METAEKNQSQEQSSNQNQNNPQKEQSQSNQTTNQTNVQEHQPKEEKPKRAFRIGIIIANELNHEDVLYYNEQLKQINSLYRDKIRIVVFGYKNDTDRLNMLNDVIFESVKPVSTIHYYKQLQYNQFDLLFIPLINSLHNDTSEDFDKYLDAGTLKIPVIAPDIYPYNKVITDEYNGFIFGNRENFIPYLTELLHKKLAMLRPCAIKAHEDVINNFNYSPQNIEILSSAFI